MRRRDKNRRPAKTPPDPSSEAGQAGQRPVFRSYFDLLEEKYGDRPAPRVVKDAPEEDPPTSPGEGPASVEAPVLVEAPAPVEAPVADGSPESVEAPTAAKHSAARHSAAKHSAAKASPARIPPAEPEGAGNAAVDATATPPARPESTTARVLPPAQPQTAVRRPSAGQIPSPRPRSRRAGRSWAWAVVMLVLIGGGLFAISTLGPESRKAEAPGENPEAENTSSVVAEVPSPEGSSMETPSSEGIPSERPIGGAEELGASDAAGRLAENESAPSPSVPGRVAQADPGNAPNPTDSGSQPTPSAPNPAAAAPRAPAVVEGQTEAATANSVEGSSARATPPIRPPASSDPGSSAPTIDESPPRQNANNADDEVVVAKAATSPARKIFAPQPAYPERARLAGEEGTVVIEGSITTTGDVRQAKVLRGISPDLDRAALEAFRTWQMQPAERNGSPVDSLYQVAFHFTLEQPESSRSAGRSPAVAGPAAQPTRDPRAAAAAAGDGAGAGDNAANDPADGTLARPLPFGSDFDPPVRSYSPLPSYPESAWATGASGDVVLMVVIDHRGNVRGISVVRALPHGITEAAVEAVRRWKFQPAQRDGKTVAVEHRLRLRFTP